MSLKSNFRIRTHDSLTRNSSLQPEPDNWFAYLKQRKLNCRKALDTSYGNITQQQAQLRSVIRSSSLDTHQKENERAVQPQEHPEQLRQPQQPRSPAHSGHNTIRRTLRTLSQLQGQSLVPSKVDDFQLNRNLVSKASDCLWDKIGHNPRRKQVLLYKAHDVDFGKVRGCFFKVSKCHKKYIVKVFNLTQRFGVVLGKSQWEAIWQQCGMTYEGVMGRVELTPEGRIAIRGAKELTARTAGEGTADTVETTIH